MKTFTPEELQEVLRLHKLWLAGSREGKCANLRNANLRHANLRDADLSGADLCGANLRSADLCYANLRDANLRDADLCGANLHGAYLRDANLCYADLRGANLRNANLRNANLRNANLSRSDLRGANLCYANLCDADLSGANLPRANLPAFSHCPEEGAFTAFKKLAGGVVATLLIPADAKRTSSLVGRKCRAEFAIVQALSGGHEVGLSSHDSTTEYRVGQEVRPDSFDPDIRVECTHGIHFFITRKEAEEY